MLLTYLKLRFKSILIWFAVVFFLIEEFIWSKGQAVVAKLFELLRITWFISRISKASKWESVLWMLLPFLVVFPFKLAAVGLFSRGHVILGLLAYLSAKLTGTALVSRVYYLAQAKLREFSLLNWLHIKITRLNMIVKTWLHAQPVYIQLKTLKQQVRSYIAVNKTSTVSRARSLFKIARTRN